MLMILLYRSALPNGKRLFQLKRSYRCRFSSEDRILWCSVKRDSEHVLLSDVTNTSELATAHSVTTSDIPLTTHPSNWSYEYVQAIILFMWSMLDMTVHYCCCKNFIFQRIYVWKMISSSRYHYGTLIRTHQISTDPDP